MNSVLLSWNHVNMIGQIRLERETNSKHIRKRKKGGIGMSRKERMDCDGCIISVELLHQLASDRKIEEIRLEDSVNGSQIRGCQDHTRE